MTYLTRLGAAIAVTVFVFACAKPVSPTASPISPSTAAALGAGAVPLTIQSEPPLLPAWITDPEEFPVGLKGQNNCTFGFGAPGAQWDFHPDGACWERRAPDGWIRQQQHRVHVPQLASCGGGAGDLSPIRVCRAPGEPNPCFIDASTGPNGCARCVVKVTCH
jgi:hypothetical protein